MPIFNFESDNQALETILTYLNNNGLQAKIIDPKRRYWFVRTESGKYYDEFIMDDFIAIGWNEIPCISENIKEEDVIALISKHYPKVAQPTRVSNQVKRFCQEMKLGDIVIIPAKGSAVLAFGVITGDVTETKALSEDEILDDACPYIRRRSVTWIKGIPKYRIDPYLYQFLRNQHAISVADDYAPFIDRVMNSFYIKDGQAYFTLSVTSKDEQRALDMPIFISAIMDRAQQLADELNVPFLADDVKLRINVQSPGLSEKFGKPVAVALVAVVVIGLFGGNLTIKYKDKSGVDVQADVGTKGLPHLIETVSNVNSKYNEDHPYSENRLKGVINRAKIKDPRKEHNQVTPVPDRESDDDINEDNQK